MIQDFSISGFVDLLAEHAGALALHDQPVGCGSEPAHRDRLPIKTNGAHVVGADDLLIGDTVALEVGGGRVAPDHLGPARVDGFEPPGFTDRTELDRWIGGVASPATSCRPA